MTTPSEIPPIPPTGVTIVHVVINEHGAIFAELIDLLTHTFEHLGRPVRVTTNRLETGRLNVVLGHTAALRPDHFAALRAGNAPYVVYQAEGLDDREGFAARNGPYLDFLRNARQIWDYSPANIRFLERAGCPNLCHVPIGYAPSLERIPPAADRDIDVLFYGALNPRRVRVLNELSRRGHAVRTLFGSYGPSRDRFIARAKIVLNVHQFATAPLEQVRISYLLNNRGFVISERSDDTPYADGVAFCDYAELVDCCESYLRPGMTAERERVASAGFATLRNVPSISCVRSALADGWLGV